jgi:hypothetical protein
MLFRNHFNMHIVLYYIRVYYHDLFKLKREYYLKSEQYHTKYLRRN